MSTKLFLIALIAFLGVSQFANAGVQLLVHFGDNAPLEVDSRDQLVTSYVPDEGVNTITASIYMHLTEGSNLYLYRFSVRYDSDILAFVAPTSSDEYQFRPGNFEEDDYIKTPFPVVSNAASKVTSQVQNGRDINNLNGTVPYPDYFSGDGYFKVATLSFTRLKTIQTPVRLIEPGKFQLSDPDVATSGLDTFLGLSDLTDPDSSEPVVLTTDGGSVSISSVPEPASILGFGLLGIFVLARRKRNKTA